MQRIVNNPDNIVDEMLEGFARCRKDIVKVARAGDVKPRGKAF